MHGETAQTQPQQKPRHVDVTRHFAAYADALALRIALGNGVGHQPEHSRVAGVIQMRDGLIGAVNRQRVLNEVVGTDGQKIKILEEQLERQRGSRYLDHGAKLDRPVSLSFVVQGGTRVINQGHGLPDF